MVVNFCRHGFHFGEQLLRRHGILLFRAVGIGVVIISVNAEAALLTVLAFRGGFCFLLRLFLFGQFQRFVCFDREQFFSVLFGDTVTDTRVFQGFFHFRRGGGAQMVNAQSAVFSGFEFPILSGRFFQRVGVFLPRFFLFGQFQRFVCFDREQFFSVLFGDTVTDTRVFQGFFHFRRGGGAQMVNAQSAVFSGFEFPILSGRFFQRGGVRFFVVCVRTLGHGIAAHGGHVSGVGVGGIVRHVFVFGVFDIFQSFDAGGVRFIVQTRHRRGRLFRTVRRVFQAFFKLFGKRRDVFVQSVGVHAGGNAFVKRRRHNGGHFFFHFFGGQTLTQKIQIHIAQTVEQLLRRFTRSVF